MKKRLLIGTLLIVMFLMSGCAIQDYLSGEAPEKSYSLLTEKDEAEDDEDDLDELDQLIEDLEEETDDIDETVDEDVDEAADEEAGEESAEEVDESTFIKINVKENEKVKLKPKAKDADEDTITYTFTEPLNAQGEWQTNYGDAGNYLITVTASDGKVTTTKKVLLTVERVNVAPVIEGITSTMTVSEGDKLSLAPKVTDPNGDMVTVTISEPVGDDGIWEIGYQKHSTYNITVTATDGELKTVKAIKLTVTKKNVPPEIKKIGDISIKEGEKVEIKPEVTDLNGDDIIVTISEPIGNDGVWETGYTDNGVYKITVTAKDDTATATETFTLTVIDVNKPPEIIDIELG